MAQAEIVVHEPNFVVDVWLDQIDGQSPRLEAIRNTEYGFGVVAASIKDEGILNVIKITHKSIESFAKKEGFPDVSAVRIIKFDRSGYFKNELYLSVFFDNDSDGFYDKSCLYKVSADREISLVLCRGNQDDKVAFVFDFTNGNNGYQAGAYLFDNLPETEQCLYYMDSDYNLTPLVASLPIGRTDLDIWGIQFDPTGLYGSYLTMADSDWNNDHKAVIYQLLPEDLSWQELTEVETINDYYYKDMCFSSGGTFGQRLYVAKPDTDTVTSIDPNGTLREFADGFSNIESVTISDDGLHMFVSDENGIYRIRKSTTIIGPVLIMREPWVESDDVHTGEKGWMICGYYGTRRYCFPARM
jgi:hypothetical protein